MENTARPWQLGCHGNSSMCGCPEMSRNVIAQCKTAKQTHGGLGKQAKSNRYKTLQIATNRYKFASRNSQLAARNSQLATRNSGVLQHRRRDEEIEIGELLLRAVVFEHPAEDRQVAEAGDF